MKSVKKSILSLWKATKGLLFGTQQKPQNENGKNLQSTAKENESLFSGQLSVPTSEPDPDIEIYKQIKNLTFSFGHKERTLKEAKPLFVQETAITFSGIHIFAFSEEFGTIVVDVPRPLAETIIERAKKKGQTVQQYIAALIEKTVFTPTFQVAGTTVQEATDAIKRFFTAIQEVESVASFSRKETNNWRKMHGIPMRRKGVKKK